MSFIHCDCVCWSSLCGPSWGCRPTGGNTWSCLMPSWVHILHMYFMIKIYQKSSILILIVCSVDTTSIECLSVLGEGPPPFGGSFTLPESRVYGQRVSCSVQRKDNHLTCLELERWVDISLFKVFGTYDYNEQNLVFQCIFIRIMFICPLFLHHKQNSSKCDLSTSKTKSRASFFFFFLLGVWVQFLIF